MLASCFDINNFVWFFLITFFTLLCLSFVYSFAFVFVFFIFFCALVMGIYLNITFVYFRFWLDFGVLCIFKLCLLFFLQILDRGSFFFLFWQWLNFWPRALTQGPSFSFLFKLLIEKMIGTGFFFSISVFST